MADTDTETQPLPNGNAAPNEEEDERMKQRPADIDADVREMERRKRVEALMSSKMFREELERVLDQQMHEGGDAPLLQRIREMVGGRMHGGNFRGPSCVLPINDIRGIEGVGYEKGEKILRCKLAALYRLVDLFGWTQTGLNGLITARLNTAEESVLTTPRGLLPHEVTASSLVKVDMQGVVQDQGTTNFPVNIEGCSWQLCVHAARPDVRCVIHVRAAAALALSATSSGLRALSHDACLLGELAYHSLPRGHLDNAEKDKLVRALGPSAKVLIVSGSGALCCGSTIEEAFYLARCLLTACEVQLKLAAVPADQLAVIDPAVAHQIYEESRKPPADSSKWRVGGEEFEALMRMLDNAGFRTGYIYRHPLVKNDVPKPKYDVELPPAVSSMGYLLEEEELYKQGIWKKGHGKTGERTRWLNSPNVYQKVEVLETGTNDPKKITKWVDANNEEWVQDGSPKHSSTPVKIDTLQFVPKNTNPKEFKALQQQIKDNRRADKISAGPTSHILEGVTWDEAGRILAEDAHNTHTADHVVLMGAASKGIIQRDYQHNATVYSAPYARNPFEHVTDSDIAHYRDIVQRRHNNHYDTDVSESEAISAAQMTSPASATETEDESRDEHRVLRIETKQAPVRSQPEVVLSDVDTTDNFLSVERAHADRTKGTKLSPEAKARIEALSVSRKHKHDYTRVANFDNIIKKFDSPDKKVDDRKNPPKCKVSLNTRLNNETVKDNALEIYQGDLIGSRSSLHSIPSIEWDAKLKPDYGLRTQSLPRAKKTVEHRLYRTRSHSGFINSYIKDPAPNHFHVPKCRVCGSNTNSYAWQLSLDRKIRKCKNRTFYSVDNLPQKCIEEDTETFKVTVEEKIVNTFQVECQETEFVESQEFTEDNYFGDFGNNFPTEAQTVIEKNSPVESADCYTNTKNDIFDQTPKANESIAQETKNMDEPIYKAELVQIDYINDNTLQVNEGEYHSFTEDNDFEDAVYESPVKDLVEKDIRDYSVPIDCYCDDYAKKDSPRKSPQKRREIAKPNVLEPILEESKSSTGEDSNLSCNDGNNTRTLSAESLLSNEDKKQSCDLTNEKTVELASSLSYVVIKKTDSEFKESGTLIDAENCDYEVESSKDIASISMTTEIQLDDNFQVLDNESQIHVTKEIDEKAFEDIAKTRTSSIEFSTLSSGGITQSLDSTAEFEKYEVIAEIISNVMYNIDFENANKPHITCQESSPDVFASNLVHASVDHETCEVSLVCKVEIALNSDSESQISNESHETEFSIAQMVTEIETNAHIMNDTVLTESTESDASFNYKIIESVFYYIFDRVFVVLSEKNKEKRNKTLKKVITVVDAEDILFTSYFITWYEDNSDVLSQAKEQKTLKQKYFIEPEDIIYTCYFDWMRNSLVNKLLTAKNENKNKDGGNDCHSLQEPTILDIENCLNNEQIVHNIDPIKELCTEGRVSESIERNISDKKHSYIQEYDVDEGIYSEDFYLNEVFDKPYFKTPNNTIIYNDDNSNEYYNTNDDTLEVASEIVSDLLERSVIDVDCSVSCEICSNDINRDAERSVSDDRYPYEDCSEEVKRSAEAENFLNETFVLDPRQRDLETMNTAFLDDDSTNYVSRSSSPKSSTAFEACTESPIKNTKDSFIGQDLSVYEKDDVIFGSPFVKKAHIISMSQTENTGGLKYWVSFDDSLQEFVEKPKPRLSKKYEENKVPSFVPFETDNINNDLIDGKEKRRSGVLLDDYNSSNKENMVNNTFDSSNTAYNTCESDQINAKLDASYQKKLIYDSRVDLHKGRSSRRYYSWPPYEDTLFYKIISKFRMSESFDPSDLDNSRVEFSF